LVTLFLIEVRRRFVRFDRHSDHKPFSYFAMSEQVTERRVAILSESEINILTQRTSVSRDDLETRLRLYENDPPDEAAERGLLTDWFLSNVEIDRDLVKPNAMTKVYGAEERHGMTKQNFAELKAFASSDIAALARENVSISRDDAEARLRFAKHIPRLFYRKANERAGYLAKCVGKVLRRLMPKAHETMEWLQRIAKILARENKTLTWISPSGFPLVICNRKVKIKKGVRFMIRGETKQKNIAVGWEDRLDAEAMERGIAPNFVHALDAALLMLAINAFARNDIASFVTVHDCVGFLAPDATRGRNIFLETMAEMYRDHDVLNEVHADARAVTDAEFPNPPDYPESSSAWSARRWKYAIQ
jgi:DNA-directed RNA polymerase